MKGFSRNDMQFSLCGLNCSLCSMNIDGYCPGCGGGAGNQGCAISRCSLSHGGIEYCFLCSEYPCNRYKGIDEYDSFITHKNQLADIEKAKMMGISAYNLVQTEKAQLLRFMLTNYNDGRRKTLFCLAVNLLELHDIKEIVDKAEQERAAKEMSIKDACALVVSMLQEKADELGITLKLRKKGKTLAT